MFKAKLAFGASRIKPALSGRPGLVGHIYLSGFLQTVFGKGRRQIQAIYPPMIWRC